MSTAEQHLAILAKHLGFEHSRILDIGSGGGELALALSLKGAKVTGIECSRDQMKRAIARQGKDCKMLFRSTHFIQKGKTKNVRFFFKLITARSDKGN